VDELRYRVARAESEYESVKKDARAAYAIWLFSGIFGGHRFYLGDTGRSIAMLFTLGGLGVWTLADVFFVGRRVRTVNGRRRAAIMARLEKVLAADSDRQLSMAELCAGTGVPERALRLCCEEFLGLSPTAYVRLRRLNLVRAALLRSDPAIATVGDVARHHGFSELGRFAATYRAAFGESPAITLQGRGPSYRDLRQSGVAVAP